jgi:hypothetical protein
VRQILGLKKNIFSVLTVTIVMGLLFYIFHQYELSSLLLTTVIAFVASDLLCLLFVRGGKGILQITLFGTRAQPKWLGFLMFFVSIFFVAVLVDLLCRILTLFISHHFPDLIADLLIGVLLALLVWIDMTLKFYVRSQNT